MARRLSQPINARVDNQHAWHEVLTKYQAIKPNPATRINIELTTGLQSLALLVGIVTSYHDPRDHP